MQDLEWLRDAKSKAPVFGGIVEALLAKSPLQKKALLPFLRERDGTFWARAEEMARRYTGYLETRGIPVAYSIDAYLKLCHDFMIEQIRFAKTGRYSASSSRDVRDSVYHSEPTMASYMHGLALSQFLWPNHYGMYDWFLKVVPGLAGVRRYLEVGPGHGLYLLGAMRAFQDAEFTAVDISPVSAALSEQLVRHSIPASRCRFEVSDVDAFSGGRYDLIVMCEVLEHLDDPVRTLRAVRGFLEPSGRMFLTTCANCPAVDHVYLFRDAEDIRARVREGGWSVVEDLPLPVANIPASCAGERVAGLNYAALVRRDDA